MALDIPNNKEIFKQRDVREGAGAIGVKTLSSDSGTAVADIKADTLVILGGEGIDTSGTAKTITITGELATSANKGVANFDGSDFFVDTGEVTLKTKTSYWSFPGSAFTCYQPSINDAVNDVDTGSCTPNSGTINFHCPVLLPQGAVVTGMKIYSQGTTFTGTLYRDAHSRTAGPTTMASATSNTEDTSITEATIDNELYSYWIGISAITSASIIDSARIKYTTKYD